MSLSSANQIKYLSRVDRLLDPLGISQKLKIAPHQLQAKLYKNDPQLADPLNLTDAQAVKAQQEYDRDYNRSVTRAQKLQSDINKRYGLQGNLTILGG